MDETWREDFAAFLAYMGPCPPKFSIERINNDGDYVPGNVKWASIHDQSANRRSNRRLEFQGLNLTLAQWSRQLDINVQTIWNRLKYGWSVEKTLSMPVRPLHRA